MYVDSGFIQIRTHTKMQVLHNAYPHVIYGTMSKIKSLEFLKRRPRVDVTFARTPLFITKHGQDATCHRQRIERKDR
jgi:hypothetical protein